MTKTHYLDFLRVTEAAALASSRWVGKGDKDSADQAAVVAMRETMNRLEMDGTIVIGEGERDEAPMLYIGEQVGSGTGPQIQIAVDPLEGTNLCANGLPNAISVLAACVTDEGHLMHAPDCYMEKLVVGAECKDVIDITAPPRVNVKAMARELGKDLDEMIIGVLDRPRHDELIRELREVGCRVHLVTDGDITLALATLDPTAGLDGLMGIGGAPEGVITAAAVCAWGGAMQARLHFPRDGQRERAERMVGGDLDRVFTTEDLASGAVMVAATGITNGDISKGVIFTRAGAITESLVMESRTATIRTIRTLHRDI